MDVGIDGAALKIWEGATVACLTATGMCVKGGTAGTGGAIGVASATVDNSAGSDGDLSMRVVCGQFWRKNSAGDAVTYAMIGLPCYMEDDNIVAGTSSSGTLQAAGLVIDVDSVKGVKVLMNPEAASMAAAYAGAAAGVALQKRTVTVGEADLTAAATTQTISIGAVLPANARVLGVSLHTHTAFTGGGSSALKLDIGTSGDVDAIVAQADLFAAAVDGEAPSCPAGIAPNKLFATGGSQLTAKFTSTGGNVTVFTAGSVIIDVLFSVLA
jgi:hypothetical protein